MMGSARESQLTAHGNRCQAKPKATSKAGWSVVGETDSDYDKRKKLQNESPNSLVVAVIKDYGNRNRTQRP